MDEAGRGALAGPLVVAAVILSPDSDLAGLDDSKKLRPRERARLAAEIKRTALALAVVRKEHTDVDRLNVFRTTQQAMEEAVLKLSPSPACVVADAVPLPGLGIPVLAEPKADGQYRCVAAASILAKVARDEIMSELSKRCPEYGWDRNKGYPTAAHLKALARWGVSPWHRRTFAPVRVLALDREC